MNTIKLLGAAQLLVFAASLLSEGLLKSIVASGSIADILVNISENISLLRLSNLVALINSLAILSLGVMFYIVLNQHNKTLALVALGCFAAEAITLAVSKIGTYGLISVSQEFVTTGSAEPSHLRTLADFLYNGIYRRGYDIHMLFFCVGGILWYYLLHKSETVPQPLSIWGLGAICLLSIPTVLALLDREFPPAAISGLLYLPFEPVLGIWLVVKGFN